jgi:hypothetical protein
MSGPKIEANEQLRQRQVELGLPEDDRLPFLCECDDERCRDVLLLTVAEYRAARESPRRYVVVEGHPYDGRVVARGEGYVLAERD